MSRGKLMLDGLGKFWRIENRNAGFGILLYNKPSMIEVVIGDHVWLGCRCIVLKGSSIANGSVIASGTTVRKGLQKENSIYGNSGPEPLKDYIRWDRKLV